MDDKKLIAILKTLTDKQLPNVLAAVVKECADRKIFGKKKLSEVMDQIQKASNGG